MEKYAAIILAAGKGTRMNEGVASPIPKVMFPLNGVPIIKHSVDLIKKAGIKKVVLVVGYKKELIESYFGRRPEGSAPAGDEVEYAVQEDQLGTGHAAAMARGNLEGKAESIIIFCGDNPLYKTDTIKKLIEVYENPPAGGIKPTVAMLSVSFDDPVFWAYGRIIRNINGDVAEIVEQKDCTPEQLKIKESNPSFYIFNSEWFWQNIDKLNSNNAQKEFYLTDMIKKAQEQGKRIVAIPVSEESEGLGINNPAQLKEAEMILQSRGAATIQL